MSLIRRTDPNLPDDWSWKRYNEYYGIRESDDAVNDEMGIYDEAVDVLATSIQRVNGQIDWTIEQLRALREQAGTSHLRGRLEDTINWLDRFARADAVAPLELAHTDELGECNRQIDPIREEIEERAEPDPDYLRDMKEDR